MISRVADSCVWLTRYLERVDTWSRMLGVNSGFSLDVALPNAERWRALLVVVGQEADFIEHVGSALIEDAEAVQQYLVWDSRQSCSLFSSLHAARENARTVREVMSVEMWESINDAWLWMKSRSARRLFDRDRDGFYERLGGQCMMFHGICYSTMLHDDPFLFMKLGRAIERVGQTARILDVKYHALGERDEDGVETAADSAQWLAILRSLGASEPFFQHSPGAVLTGSEVARFLIFDSSFPRSVMHNLERTRGLLLRLRRDDPEDLERASWDKVEAFHTRLAGMTMDDIHEAGLHESLTWMVDTTTELCGAIHTDYLDPPLQMQRWHDQVRGQSQSQA